MNQLEFFDIPSPCIGVCTANSKGYCKGCLRSRDERIYWAKLSNEDRRKVIRLCAARKCKLLDAMRKNALATEQNIAPQIDDLFN
ncbi:MAG: DUF1289 domain-containing protein [Alphaproteobacteria bacterium]|nr:DUF1289 domain-containing protein [Alphaproteobacteria bacterium]